MTTKVKTPRDRQREKLYAWEKTHWPAEGEWIITPTSSRPSREMLSLEECFNLVAMIWSWPVFTGTRLPMNRRPAIRDGRGRRCPAYYGGYWPNIRIPRWGRFREVVLHETAHAILDAMGHGHDVEAHGPEFVGLLIYLLADGKAAEVERLWRSAIHAGLRVKLFHPR